MLPQLKASESNPPLYYVLAWGWAKAFGTGEIGMRSLSALFGAATVPVAYLIGRELASKRAGLITAAIVAVNPMLIWYSQEARSYAVLVFFGALALLFFVRALNSRHGRDLGLWALASGLALCSHYFAVFAVAIEAAWLLVALRSRGRSVLPAIGAVTAVGLALRPDPGGACLRGALASRPARWVPREARGGVGPGRGGGGGAARLRRRARR